MYNARSNKCHHPTSPNTAPATQNGSRAWLSSHMKPHFQCAEQQVSRSNLTKYRACHTKWLACLIVVTYETSLTTRGAAGVTIQPHQILRLPHRMTHMLDPRYICNVIYSARSIRCHDPTARNTAPATQNDSHAWSSSHMKRLLQCAEQQVSPSNLTKYCACHTEWLACLIVVTYETSFTMRGATGVTIKPHQIPRLPHKMTRMLDRRHIWNLISNARSNRYHDPTSPNTAPATQNDSHAWSSSHMKPHFQCAEQQLSRSNLTKYCAWHEKWHCKISKKISKNRWNVISNAGPIRPWSEHDPSMIRPWKRKPQPASQVSLLFEVPRSTFYCKIQRFAPNLTFKPSPNTAPTTKRYTWPSPSAAPATKSDTWTSPSTAPATQNDSHAWSSSHMKPHFQCAEQQVSRSNLTKYCACHTKWLACLILVTYETSFPMRGATGITIQPHQILRLARKMTLQDFKENLQKQVKRHFQCGADPTMIRAWSEHDPTMKTQTATRLASQLAFRGPQKYNVSRPILHSNLHQILRLPQKDTLDLHQVLHLPRKVTLELHQVLRLPHRMARVLDPRHIWNLISNARSNRYHDPTSPNTAPGTKNDTARFQRKSPKTGETSFPMRGRSDHDPSMIRPWKRKPQPASQVSLLFEVPRSIFYCKIQRFAPNLTFKPSPNTAPTTKRYTWPSPSAAPATKSDTWTSPSTAPATKSDITNFSKYCTCHEKWHFNFTKYCAGHCTVTELYCTLLYLTLLYVTLLYLTLLYLTLLDTTLRDTTLLGSYSTWLYSTWPAPLDLTLLRCRSYIGSFST